MGTASKSDIIRQQICVLAIAGFLLLAACGGGGAASPEESAETSLSTSFSDGVIYGAVIDFATQQGIPDATVRASLGSASEETATTDTTGAFTISGLNAGEYQLRVDAAGYGLYSETVVLQQGLDDLYFAAAGTAGTIALYLPCTVTTHVLSDGAPVPQATVYVYESGKFSTPLVTTVTDTTGQVVLPRLPQQTGLALIVPSADTNADGRYDYETGSDFFSCYESTLTTALNIDHAETALALTVKDRSTSRLSHWATTLPAAQPFHITFNYPITLDSTRDDGGLMLTTMRNLVLSDHPLHNRNETVPLKATLSASGTVLTIAPQAALIENESYTVEGPIGTDVNGYHTTYDLKQFGLGGFVPLAAAWGLADITVDNYNDSNTSEFSSTVYVEFPEPVMGTITVLSSKNTSLTPAEQTLGKSVSTQSFEVVLVIDEDSGGCHSAAEAVCTNQGDVRYRVPLPIQMPDHTAAQSRSVTFLVDVQDAEGNWVQGEVTTSVQ